MTSRVRQLRVRRRTPQPGLGLAEAPQQLKRTKKQLKLWKML